MKHVLINMMLITLISISTAGCTVIRIMQTNAGHAIEKTVENIEERKTQLSQRDFRLGFDATGSRLGVRLEYRPYYSLEKRELVTYKPKKGGRSLEMLMGLASVGLLSWAVVDSLVETGELKVNDQGGLSKVYEFDWNRANALQKAIMIGVPLDAILWVYYATQYETTVHEPWKRKGEIIGDWQVLRNHPYRIELPDYNFGKDYESESGNERVQISDFLAHVENPSRFKDVDSVSLRASTEFDGKAYQKTLRFTSQSQLQPFHCIVPSIGPRIHALLILLENDIDIRESVKQNGDQMKKLLRSASYHAKVHLTVMTSTKELEGEVTTMELSDGIRNDDNNPDEQGLITGDQVINWLKNLHSGTDDTILIYYNGHGNMPGYNDDHILNFDQETGDKIIRSELRKELQRKKGSLKMLITDTCSNRAGTPKSVAKNLNYFTNVDQRIKSSYIKNLLFQHAGILDITAAQPDQYAWGDPDIGGFFTSGLFQSLTDKSADMNKDGFLTWQEIFKTTQQKTEELFKELKETGVVLGDDIERMRNQETQKPSSYSLPTRTK